MTAPLPPATNESTPPKLSVIVVNWNTRDMLRACLRSAHETLPPPTFEVLVVDNASHDGSAAMVRSEFPDARITANDENVGFGRANNQAICSARGEYLLLLNPDAQLQPYTARRLVEHLDSEPSVAITAGEVRNPDGTFQSGYFTFPTFAHHVRCVLNRERGHYLRWKATYSRHPPVREVDWVAGACMVVRRRAIEDAGLFDERYFLFSEETDWCFRMRLAGWKVHYLSDVGVVHLGGGSTRQTPVETIAQALRGQLLYSWSHHGPLAALALSGLTTVLALAFLARAPLLLLRRSPGDGPAAARSWRAGLTILKYVTQTVYDHKPRIPRLH